MIYNYTNLINYFSAENNNKFLEKLYTSYNFCESINSKLNYLPKRATNNYSFAKSLSNILANDIIRKESIYRNDFKTKSLIKLIEDKDFNDNLNWVDFEEFKNYIKLIINEENKDILSENKIIEIINKIFDIENDQESIDLYQVVEDNNQINEDIDSKFQEIENDKENNEIN